MRVVRIYEKEYWKCDSQGSSASVNGKSFHTSLDDDIPKSLMAEYFGKVVVIKNYDDIFYIENDIHDFSWTYDAIQEEYEKEDYPELFL
jgi:predicted lipid-binding transport protein (Tim44 family)